MNLAALASRLYRAWRTLVRSAAHRAQAVRAVHDQPVVPLPGQRRGHGGHAPHQVGHGEVLREEVHPPGLDLGEVEHVVDQPQEVPARLGDLLQVAAEGGGGVVAEVLRLLLEHLGVADDGVERACAARGSWWPGTGSCAGWPPPARGPWPPVPGRGGRCGWPARTGWRRSAAAPPPRPGRRPACAGRRSGPPARGPRAAGAPPAGPGTPACTSAGERVAPVRAFGEEVRHLDRGARRRRAPPPRAAPGAAGRRGGDVGAPVEPVRPSAGGTRPPPRRTRR